MSTKVVHCKKEPYDVYIGRPSKWGNLFSHKTNSKYETIYVGTVEEAINSYKDWLDKEIFLNPNILDEIKKELKGKILGCWCKPGPCHGDILANWADS